MKYQLCIISIYFSLHSISCFAQSDKESIAIETKENRKEEKLKKKYASWDSCFIVKADGDTIYGKVITEKTKVVLQADI